MNLMGKMPLHQVNTINFWAKTTAEGKPGISVYEHMINVGCVARCLSEISLEFLERFHLTSSLIGALAGLHDLGKISPGFQRKCEAWLQENNLSVIARNNVWDSAMESDHGKVSHAAIQEFFLDIGIERKTAKFVSSLLGAHHGRLNPPNDRGYRPDKLIHENHSSIDWNTERMANAKRVWEFFSSDSLSFSLEEDSPALWWLAGLTSIADWIGSDERFFSLYPKKNSLDSKSSAIEAIDTIGLKRITYHMDLSFHDLFHDMGKPEIKWIPNDMQKKVHDTIKRPGVYIVEAPMGTGKTEAALWAAYRLLVEAKASGIYFALPTQVTSNRIHLRVNDFIQRICVEKSVSRLIHANSWLINKDFNIYVTATEKKTLISDDARTGRDWFASPKRALVAPFGVGTIDQALLGILASKHFFVRQFALTGKVVILDEIHSYDLYTGTLIDKLITTLEGLGCTVIVLSATLSGARRDQIINCPKNEDSKEESESPYPFITGRFEKKPILPLAPMSQEKRSIKVDFVLNEEAVEEAIRFAYDGGAVLWICNTVNMAQVQYRRLAKLVNNEFPIGILHSRFPFWRREMLENEWMERFGKDGKLRRGSILISTQVVEQSVDLDADLLITELAPTDMLLQRLGRLWRHERNNRPVRKARICIIKEEKNLDEFRTMEPGKIKETLGNKAYVYAPFILLRTLELWEKQSKDVGEITIPIQIRQLIEATYRSRETEPKSWQILADDWFGTDSAKKMIASRNCNLWQIALEDEEGVQTRLNEVPTINLILIIAIADNEACFIDKSLCRLSFEEYQLSTAQAIHKNLVKIPEYCFERISPPLIFSHYLSGKYCIGIVAEDGTVTVEGLKKGTELFYSDNLGLVIKRIK